MTVFHPRLRSAGSQMAGAAANVAAVRAVARTYYSRTSRSLACLARSAYRARQDRSNEWLAVLDGPGNRRLGVAEVLFGRSSELAAITAFVERAGIGGEALLLLGEPGVGKTALLDAAASAAAEAGMSVLRAAGAQFEADLPFSGLHQVLLPLLDEFGRLDAVHGGALSAALGYGASPAPDRMLVSAATLTVLRHAAADSPVLVVVDDMPWMDRATAGVLGFVARRLAGTRVGFLAASRTGEEGFFERSGLPARELAPLDSRAAQSLLADRFPALAPALRQRVLSEAQGNPLALLELPAAPDGTAAGIGAESAADASADPPPAGPVR